MPFLVAELAANVFFAGALIGSAVWADRVGAATVLKRGAWMAMALGLVFGTGLASGSLWLVFATLAAALTVMGFVYGPLGPWLTRLFPVELRYSGISLAFSAGGVVGGAVAPIAATKLASMGHLPLAGMLLSVAGGLTLVGARLGKPA